MYGFAIINNKADIKYENNLTQASTSEMNFCKMHNHQLSQIFLRIYVLNY